MTIDPTTPVETFDSLDKSITHQLRSLAAIMMSFARSFAKPPKSVEGQPWFVTLVVYSLSLIVSVLFLAGCLTAILAAGCVLLVSRVTKAVVLHVQAKKQENPAEKHTCSTCGAEEENVFTMGWTCPNCHKDVDEYPEQVRKAD